MEKIIKIGDYSIPVRSTAASLIKYKANFGRDGLADLIRLAKSVKNNNEAADGELNVDDIDEDTFDMDMFFRFLWVFAKSANPEIPPMEDWLEGYDIPPLTFAMTALPQTLELLGTTIKSTTVSKNSIAAVKKK